jgi:glutamyl-tRNA synthetase
VIRARFAPSPTGDLHVGSASTALASFVAATRAGGVNVLRVEDIDTPRVVRGAEGRIVEDLRWLGLSWDEGPEVGGPYGPYVQSARVERYAEAIASLRAQGLVYPCDCSRAEIAARMKKPEAAADTRAATEASAPHGEELVYPGTCRDLPRDREMKRPPALRLRIPDDSVVTFQDGVAGTISSNVSMQCGDFVLSRADGLFAYHLAVSLDDLAMKITDVVRGRDLLSSTARQILLMRLMGARDPEIPRYTHVPLVLGRDGARLAKRDPRVVVRDLRAVGVAPEAILGVLAKGLGIVPDAAPRSATEIARIATLPFSAEPFCYDDSALVA